MSSMAYASGRLCEANANSTASAHEPVLIATNLKRLQICALSRHDAVRSQRKSKHLSRSALNDFGRGILWKRVRLRVSNLVSAIARASSGQRLTTLFKNDATTFGSPHARMKLSPSSDSCSTADIAWSTVRSTEFMFHRGPIGFLFYWRGWEESSPPDLWLPVAAPATSQMAS